MKIIEIAILAVLVIAAIFVLVNGTKTSSGNAAMVSTPAVDLPQPGQAESEFAEAASAESTDAESAAEGEGELAGTYIDLSIDSEYEIAGFDVSSTGGSLTIKDEAGSELVRFKLNSKGNVEPQSNQPKGTRVANAWAGPPVETAAKYHVYQKQADGENGEIPLLSFYFDAGYVEIVPGAEMERKNASSYRGITKTWQWD